MIQFTDVSFWNSGKDLYNNVSFTIEEGDHAVLIGRNGCGKTSLLNLIMDPEKYTYEGKIEKNAGKIACVSQFVSHESKPVTVFEYLSRPFAALQERSDELCRKMESGDDFQTACDGYQQCMDEMDAVDFYNYEVNIKKELAVAGLAAAENQTVDKISGGEFKLVSIVGALLQKPALLVLDEPDVFLDMSNLLGLSRLINSYDGAVLTVTHNRLLLSACFNKVLHIENLTLNEFPGNYAEYTRAMLENKIDIQENYMKLDDFIQLQHDLIEKRRVAADELTDSSKGRQLRARVHYLERLYRMRGEDAFAEECNYDFCFPFEEMAEEGEDAKEPVCSLENYTLAFDGVPLVSDINLAVMPGEKVAIVGDNGSGKSSLLNVLYGTLAGRDGVGFFRQIYDEDNPKKLSGGEQNIAKLKELTKEHNDVLILDEPTSHLDIYAQEALEKAVDDYKGTVLLVSHDFYLVAGCADRIFLLEDGTMREMSGRAYRKSVYKKFMTSELLEEQRARKQTEMEINGLLLQGKYEEARLLLTEL